MKVITPKGIKLLGNITLAERGNKVTVIACGNAFGNFVPL